MTRSQVFGVTLPYLAEWRMHRYLSMRELAKLAGITSRTVRNIEVGGVARWDTIKLLAVALEVAPATLATQRPRKSKAARSAA